VPGLNLGSRYRVVGDIASGGMGSIQLAVSSDKGTPRPVAIKQLHAHLVDDPQMVASFVDEARISSRLMHPNVVRVHDVDMLGERLVIVMEYVDGVPLSQIFRARRRSNQPLPIRVTRRILHDALVGLHAAHEQCDEAGQPLRLVHRDVSPHNLLVGADGVTRVTDFGIALTTGRLAATRTDGLVKGKLQYLSPEQIYRRPVDRRADVFAAGVVLWEALAGRPLFSGATEAETLAMVLSEPIQPPSNVCMDVPLELDEICLKALEREVERRYPTAAAFATALGASDMASLEEVSAVVEEVGAESLAKRRQLITSALANPDALPAPARGPDSDGQAVVAAPVATPAGSRSRGGLTVVALLVGTVAGGVLVSLATRGPSTPSPAARASAEPAAASEPAAAPTPHSSAPVTAATSTGGSEVSSAGAPPSAPPVVVTSTPSTPTGARVAAPRPTGTAARGGGTRRPPDAGAARPFMPSDL